MIFGYDTNLVNSYFAPIIIFLRKNMLTVRIEPTTIWLIRFVLSVKPTQF